MQTDLKLGRLRSSITEAAIFKRYPSDVLIVQDKTSWVLYFKRWLFWDLLQETMALAKGWGEYEDSLPFAFIIIRQAGHLKVQNIKSEIVDSSNYNNVLWVNKTLFETTNMSRNVCIAFTGKVWNRRGITGGFEQVPWYEYTWCHKVEWEVWYAYLKCDILHYIAFNTIVSRDGFGDIAVGAPGE